LEVTLRYDWGSRSSFCLPKPQFMHFSIQLSTNILSLVDSFHEIGRSKRQSSHERVSASWIAKNNACPWKTANICSDQFETPCQSSQETSSRKDQTNRFKTDFGGARRVEKMSTCECYERGWYLRAVPSIKASKLKSTAYFWNPLLFAIYIGRQCERNWSLELSTRTGVNLPNSISARIFAGDNHDGYSYYTYSLEWFSTTISVRFNSQTLQYQEKYSHSHPPNWNFCPVTIISFRGIGTPESDFNL